ncbi:hypothetical protein KKC94_00585 [Patescibacteria group bacterium]|nr:hypothetical protein [Patescibacteria group bacterium]
MQRFTIFSILLSLTLLFFIGDILSHNYLKADISGIDNAKDLNVATAEPLLAEPKIDEETTEPVKQNSEDEVTLSSISVIEPELSALNFQLVGFSNPILKEAQFNGSVFQIIDFSDQTDAYVYQSNIFEDETYVGAVSEIKYPTEIGAFQGYLKIRERAMGLLDYGEVNETNTYGDTSFYFNHKIKTKTVHIVVKESDTLYAFEYDYGYHEKMKQLFGILP